jgi:hypothetical protein
VQTRSIGRAAVGSTGITVSAGREGTTANSAETLASNHTRRGATAVVGFHVAYTDTGIEVEARLEARVYGVAPRHCETICLYRYQRLSNGDGARLQARCQWREVNNEGDGVSSADVQ